MKAARIKNYGTPSDISITTIEDPVPAENHVLLRVHAASINPFDAKLISGSFRDSIALDFPITLGGDVAGTVISVGKKVTTLKPGDRVYGQASVVSGGSGAFAELATSSTGQLAIMPRNLGFAEAASLPLVGVSAVQALTEHLSVTPGQRLFIHGGSGGIGSLAIQLAKHFGANVTTTASSEGIAYVRGRGADSVIDYKNEDIANLSGSYDAVFDTVGGKDFSVLLGLLKPKGVGVSMVGPIDNTDADKRDVKAYIQSTHVTTEMLDILTDFVEQAVVTPSVEAIYPLSNIADAFRAKATGAIRGKIVIEIATG